MNPKQLQIEAQEVTRIEFPRSYRIGSQRMSYSWF